MSVIRLNLQLGFSLFSQPGKSLKKMLTPLQARRLEKRARDDVMSVLKKTIYFLNTRCSGGSLSNFRGLQATSPFFSTFLKEVTFVPDILF